MGFLLHRPLCNTEYCGRCGYSTHIIIANKKLDLVPNESHQMWDVVCLYFLWLYWFCELFVWHCLGSGSGVCFFGSLIGGLIF